MDLKEEIKRLAIQAKYDSFQLAKLPTQQKNDALSKIADNLEKDMEEILFKNEIDVEAAKETGLSAALIDRLTLNEKRIKNIADSVRKIIELPDPIGEIIKEWETNKGLKIKKVRVPLGVIGMIYEARPNVTVDAAALCLKSGNAVLLKGGSQAINSNSELVKVIQQAIKETDIPSGAVQFINFIERQAVMEMIKLDKLIDVIIPRGNEEMIRNIIENSTIPVISHGKGVCHVYVDKDADLKMAEEICYNAKVQRPGVCNAMETLLVHNDVAPQFLPLIVQKYRQAKVEIRGDEKVAQMIDNIIPATEEDWYTEYLDKIISIKVVSSVDDAIKHINKYGSGHSDAIVTNNFEVAEKFLKEVNSSCVYKNASTRFTDGEEFGFGAEIGISTQKLHARGPMGLKELTTYKYLIYGEGQIRE